VPDFSARGKQSRNRSSAQHAESPLFIAHILRAEQILLKSGVGEAVTELFALRRMIWKEYVDKKLSPARIIEYKTGLDDVGSWDRWVVKLVYDGKIYRADINFSSESEEMTSELYIDDIFVIKLGWRGYICFNDAILYRFKYGAWMKDIVKLRVDIQTFEENEKLRAIDNDAMERASRIEF
jgi:hypothetical protein